MSVSPEPFLRKFRASRPAACEGREERGLLPGASLLRAPHHRVSRVASKAPRTGFPVERKKKIWSGRRRRAKSDGKEKRRERGRRRTRGVETGRRGRRGRFSPAEDADDSVPFVPICRAIHAYPDRSLMTIPGPARRGGQGRQLPSFARTHLAAASNRSFPGK